MDHSRYPLGHCRSRRPVGLCCHRRHVLAAGFCCSRSHAITGWSVAGVSQRHDDRLPGDGLCQHDLGHAVGSDRAAAGGADGLDRDLPQASRWRAAPRSLIEFQLLFWACWWGAATAAIFAPMMATVTGWFETHRSLAVSLGVGRHGDGADDHVARSWPGSSKAMTWRTTMQILCRGRRFHHDFRSRLLVRPPAPRLQAVAACGPAMAGPQSEDVAVAGATVAAVHHPSCDEFLLLRHAFRPDHPHRELMPSVAAFPMLAAVFDLQRGRAGGVGRPHRLRACSADRFGAKRVLVLGLLVQAFGALAYVLRARTSPRSTRSLRCSASSMAGVMPLIYSVLGAGRISPLKMMGTVNRRPPRWPAASAWPRGRWAGGPDLRQPSPATRGCISARGAWALARFLMAMSFRPFSQSAGLRQCRRDPSIAWTKRRLPRRPTFSPCTDPGSVGTRLAPVADCGWR